ncbi:MAG: ribose-phosphate pyrophosphokinase [Candidatus Kerfeldbacteria bacterium]|nr:ribose-phosphate pyrophosphokinase [Candidatus Kerfeldbacteria bacterium]
MRTLERSKFVNGLKIFSTRQSEYFAKRVIKALRVRLGLVEVKNFSDGEIWAKYKENVRGFDVYIIGSTNPPTDNLFELLIMIDAARRASAGRVTAVIPYFGYARQERKDQPRTPITAKLVANMISNAGADRVITMDLHAPAIQGFFDIPVDHLYASPTFIPWFKRKAIPRLTVVSPDLGGIKRARAYAKYLGAKIAMIDKRRPGQNQAEVMNIIGEVKGRNILLVDDLIDTAGTFIGGARKLKEMGALKIYGCCTHPILSSDAIPRLQQSDITLLAVSDSIPLKAKYQKIEVKSVANIFAKAILLSHRNKSVSRLFLENRD